MIMSIRAIGRTERFDFEVKDNQFKHFDRILSEAEYDAEHYIKEIESQGHRIESHKIKFENVEIELNYTGPNLRIYKFILEVKMYSNVEPA
jgi:hypothetical protein